MRLEVQRAVGVDGEGEVNRRPSVEHDVVTLDGVGPVPSSAIAVDRRGGEVPRPGVHRHREDPRERRLALGRLVARRSVGERILGGERPPVRAIERRRHRRDRRRGGASTGRSLKRTSSTAGRTTRFRPSCLRAAASLSQTRRVWPPCRSRRSAGRGRVGARSSLPPLSSRAAERAVEAVVDGRGHDRRRSPVDGCLGLVGEVGAVVGLARR